MPSNTPSISAATPSPLPTTSQPNYGQQYPQARPPVSPAPLVQQASYGSHGTGHSVTQTNPMYQSQSNYSQYTAASTPLPQHQSSSTFQYQNHTISRPVAATTASHSSHSNVYNPPRAVEVYTLPEVANASIPHDIRDQFHCDAYGKIVFYTAPPIDTTTEQMQAFNHSLRYLADKARRKDSIARKRKQRDTEKEADLHSNPKRLKENSEQKRRNVLDCSLDAIEAWSKQINTSTDELYLQMHGGNWEEFRELGK